MTIDHKNGLIFSNKSVTHLGFIFIYKVHSPTFVSDYKEVFDELKRQQAKGRIRYYSVCNFGPQNMKDALAVGAQPITNQVRKWLFPLQLR